MGWEAFSKNIQFKIGVGNRIKILDWSRDRSEERRVGKEC